MQTFSTSVVASRDEMASVLQELVDSVRGALELDEPQTVPTVHGFRLSASGERQQLVVTASTRNLPAELRTHEPQLDARVEFSVTAELSGEVGDVASQEVSRAVQLPFTSTEMKLLRAEMPLTSGLPHARRVLQQVFGDPDCRPLDGIAAIFTIHHQTDFVVMIEAAIELGLDPDLTTVIDKQYKYLYRGRVDRHLTHRLGVKVGRYQDRTRVLFEHFSRAITSGNVPTVVFDDGGYVLPVMQTELRELAGGIRGIVEQTMSGISAIQPYTGLDEAPRMFSVAESKLKRTIEAHGVASAGARNYLRLFPNRKMEGQRVLVTGYGRIGEALAEYLKASRATVAVCDPDVNKLVVALERGFPTYRSATEAIESFRPSIIFGCAGNWTRGEPRPSVTVEELGLSRSRVVLISMTSRDYEFDKDNLARIAISSRPMEKYLGTVYEIENRHGSTIDIELIADGFPINFFEAESMPNEHSDLILASMLIGGSVVARMPELLDDYNARVERADQILDESGLLEQYYERHR